MDKIPGALKRPRFEAGDSLGATGLGAEQAWRHQRFRRHNRTLHGTGVVCGLLVAPALVPSQPWAVIVCPGYALGPYGDEIIVGCAALVDVRDWVWVRPADTPQTAAIAIRYAELPAGSRPYAGASCGCDAPKTTTSMMREHYRIDVLWSMPDPGTAAAIDLCKDAPPCTPCPQEPHVLLAAVRIPADEGTAIVRADIDMSVRRAV